MNSLVYIYSLVYLSKTIMSGKIATALTKAEILNFNSDTTTGGIMFVIPFMNNDTTFSVFNGIVTDNDDKVRLSNMSVGSVALTNDMLCDYDCFAKCLTEFVEVLKGTDHVLTSTEYESTLNAVYSQTCKKQPEVVVSDADYDDNIKETVSDEKPELTSTKVEPADKAETTKQVDDSVRQYVDSVKKMFESMGFTVKECITEEYTGQCPIHGKSNSTKPEPKVETREEQIESLRKDLQLINTTMTDISNLLESCPYKIDYTMNAVIKTIGALTIESKDVLERYNKLM